MMAGRYRVLLGRVGTVVEGIAHYHPHGAHIDLSASEAKRLLELGAVADTQAPVPIEPKSKPAPSEGTTT